jgi:Na+/proline symporter
MLLGRYLPAGMLGLAVSGILAAIMSTVSSNMNFGAQVFLNDVYRRSLVRDASNRHYLFVGRLVAAGIVVLAVFVATTAQNVIDISVFMLGLSSAELTANWAQWWWWRFNGKARLAASFGGPLLFLFNQFVVFRYFVHAGPESVYLVVFASMGATCLLWVMVARMTDPEPEEKLIEFYLRARPLGAWGPIARKAGLQPAGWNPIIRGLIAAALGAVMVGSFVVALSAAFVANWITAVTALLIGCAATAAFRGRTTVNPDNP